MTILPHLRLLWLLILLAGQAACAQRVVHVIVALADNEHQQGVKQWGSLGNGQDPGKNLLWGAGHGVRTYFDRAKEWERLETKRPQVAHILERAVWKHRDSAVYVVADAYDGRHLLEATQDLLLYASGGGAALIGLGGKVISAGGDADLIVYMGHNGLMDHKVEQVYRPAQEHDTEVMILASLSRGFFANALRATGARPLLWTTGVIVPEAYLLHNALQVWVAHGTDEAIRESAAKAYDRHRSSTFAGAMRLLVTGW